MRTLQRHRDAVVRRAPLRRRLRFCSYRGHSQRDMWLKGGRVRRSCTHAQTHSQKLRKHGGPNANAVSHGRPEQGLLLLFFFFPSPAQEGSVFNILKTTLGAGGVYAVASGVTTHVPGFSLDQNDSVGQQREMDK